MAYQNALGGALNGLIGGFASTGGNPIGGLIGGAIGLFGGLFGKKKKPRPAIDPISLPTAADIAFASQVLMPRSAYLGGRMGPGAASNSSVNIQNVNVSFPDVRNPEDARAAGRAFAAGMSDQARSLNDQYRRGSSRRFG